MIFEQKLKHFLILFQICGLDSQALTNQTEFIKLLRIWNYILIATAVGGALAVYSLSNAIFSDIDPIGKLTDIVQVMTPLVTYFVVLLEAVVQRNTQQQILLQMTELDHSLQAMGVLQLNKRWQQMKKFFFIKFILINIACLSFELLIIGSFFGRDAWAYDWLVKLPTFVFNRISDLRYMLYVDCLKIYIEILNELIFGFRKWESNEANSKNIWVIKSKDIGQQRRLKQLKQLYSLTWELSELLNARMGRTILATITANFIELTINLYWVYAYLHIRTLVLESWYYPVPRLILLIALFNTCEHCWRHIRRTHECIHQISRHKPALISSAMLKRFCLQVNHSQIVLSANGFFNIDYQTLNSVSNSTTYNLVR